MRIVKKVLVLSLLICIIALNSQTVSSNSKLMPDDILKLHENGMSTDDLIHKIQTNGINFEVSLPVLEKFINVGISQEVLEVLLGYDPSRMRKTVKTYGFSKDVKSGIAVITNPPGLSVKIDGKDHGVSPSMSNKIKPGKHVVNVSHPLFFPRQEEIEFNGEEDVVINWEMEPREPVVRISVGIDRKTNEPWSWILTPRKQCPGCDVTTMFKAWKPTTTTGEAIFLLTDEAKKLFRGQATGCLELNVWRGEVRRDLPLRKLPPPDTRYYVTDVRIQGIETVDIEIDIKIPELNTSEPEVTMKGDSGYLIQAELAPKGKKKSKSYDEMIESLDGIVE